MHLIVDARCYQQPNHACVNTKYDYEREIWYFKANVLKMKKLRHFLISQGARILSRGRNVTNASGYARLQTKLKSIKVLLFKFTAHVNTQLQ